jgi:hypothetical protein
MCVSCPFFQIEGRQPCRVLTQFDALPLMQKKYVAGVDSEEQAQLEAKPGGL